MRILKRGRLRLSPLVQALRFLTTALVVLASGTCGMDTINYLPYIDAANVTTTMNYRAEIRNLPSGPGHREINAVSLDTSMTPPRLTIDPEDALSNFMSNFIVYYRIYISAVLLNFVSEADLGTVNPTLASDYNALKPYTVTTNNYAASVGSAFASRNYWVMDFDNASSNQRYLRRSVQLITPYPSDRYFINADDLKRYNYLNAINNADVTGTANDPYTYIALYIAHTAFSPTTLSPYFSSPTFLGVFLLPNPSS